MSFADRLPAPMRGPFFMLLAAAMFTVMGGCVRIIADEIHPLQTGFFRSAFGLVLMLPWILRRDFFDLMRTRRHGLYFLRGLTSAAGQAFYFVAIVFLPMSDAISLTFTAPLFGTILAVFVLGEVLKWHRSIAMVIGFAGVLIVLRPGFADLDWTTSTPLLAAIAMAGIWTLVKLLSATEPTERVVFYMMVYTMPFSLVPALFVWQPMTLTHVLWMFGAAFFGNAGQFAITRAYRSAEATAVFPYDFARLPFTAIIAFWVFGQQPDIWTWLGAAVIFGSTVYLTQREAAARKRERRAAAERAT